jgi:methionine synthase II (cobalamin-independent)
VPSQAEFDVAVDSLRKEAQIWVEQSAQMKAIVAKASGLFRNHFEAGLFQITVDTYNEVAHKIVDRCNEAVKAFSDIGATLQQVATTYEKEDHNQAHKFHNLY